MKFSLNHYDDLYLGLAVRKLLLFYNVNNELLPFCVFFANLCVKNCVMCIKYSFLTASPRFSIGWRETNCGFMD
jgi:hypothetical protein